MDANILKKGELLWKVVVTLKKKKKRNWYKRMLPRELMCNILYRSLTYYLQGK